MADDLKLKFTSWADWDIEMRDRAEREAERERANPVLARIKATIDALEEESRISNLKFQEEYHTEHREEFAHEALAEAHRVVAEHASAANKAKAEREFAVVVEVVEQVCSTRGTKAQASKDLARDIKKAVDALLRARKMGPAGIGRLQRALGAVKAKINSK
jgi:hypothetical protein